MKLSSEKLGSELDKKYIFLGSDGTSDYFLNSKNMECIHRYSTETFLYICDEKYMDKEIVELLKKKLSKILILL
jgi:hypothetical protein